MSTQPKPSIVFAHGIWADGSCFSKVIPPLQAEGYQVVASQHGLDSLEGDVATLISKLGRVTFDVDSSHVPMLSQPGFVLDVVRTAASSL